MSLLAARVEIVARISLFLAFAICFGSRFSTLHFYLPAALAARPDGMGAN